MYQCRVTYGEFLQPLPVLDKWSKVEWCLLKYSSRSLNINIYWRKKLPMSGQFLTRSYARGGYRSSHLTRLSALFNDLIIHDWQTFLFALTFYGVTISIIDRKCRIVQNDIKFLPEKAITLTCTDTIPVLTEGNANSSVQIPPIRAKSINVF